MSMSKRFARCGVGGDGMPDLRDRDRYGDGIPNWRDRGDGRTQRR